MRQCTFFTDFIQALIEGSWRPQKLDKQTVRRVLDEAGLPQPALYQTVDDPADFNFAALPETFVLKPTHLHSGHGVYVFVRQGDAYLDLRSEQLLREEDIVSRLRQTALEQRVPEANRYWAEERVWNKEQP